MSYSTLLDYAASQGNALQTEIAAALVKNSALLQLMPFTGVSGFEASSQVITGYPTISARNVNEGTAYKKADRSKVKYKLSIFDENSAIDEALLKAKSDPNSYRADEDMAFLNAITQGFSALGFYGNPATDDATFTGVATTLNTVNATTVIDGSGTGSSLTSIYFAHVGRGGLYGIYNENSSALPIAEDMGSRLVTDSGGTNQFWAKVTHFNWMAGIVAHEAGIGRYANLDASNKPTIANIMKIVRQMKLAPNLILCNRDGAVWIDELLQGKLQAGSNDKNLAQFVDTIGGIPVVIDDNIVSTESEIT